MLGDLVEVKQILVFLVVFLCVGQTELFFKYQTKLVS